MPPMTRNDLVQAVTILTPTTGCPIVTSEQVKAWCLVQVPVVDIDSLQSGRTNRHFEDADKGEAADQGRLAKFKRGPSRTDDVGWCLVTDVFKCASCDPTWTQLIFDADDKRWIWD